MRCTDQKLLLLKFKHIKTLRDLQNWNSVESLTASSVRLSAGKGIEVLALGNPALQPGSLKST